MSVVNLAERRAGKDYVKHWTPCLVRTLYGGSGNPVFVAATLPDGRIVELVQPWGTARFRQFLDAFDISEREFVGVANEVAEARTAPDGFLEFRKYRKGAA